MLYIVPTPIGNLSDLSSRALETLSRVDLIAAEDTRHTRKLLAAHDIHTRMVSFHEHNERRMVPRLVERLRSGETLALVSDAGTPGISDPGYSLIRACIDADLDVTALPGPVALIPALVLSGLPTHSFVYRGFPPRKKGRRKTFLQVDLNCEYTLIYYESCYRIAALVEDALGIFGDRRGAVVNDLTKRFEAVERGRLSALLQHLQARTPKGEFVLLIEGHNDDLPTQEGEGQTSAPQHTPSTIESAPDAGQTSDSQHVPLDVPSTIELAPDARQTSDSPYVTTAVETLQSGLDELRIALTSTETPDNDIVLRVEALANDVRSLLRELEQQPERS